MALQNKMLTGGYLQRDICMLAEKFGLSAEFFFSKQEILAMEKPKWHSSLVKRGSEQVDHETNRRLCRSATRIAQRIDFHNVES